MLMAKFMRYMTRSGIVSDARLLEMYPPFVPMRIKVLEISDNWRSVRIRLPLNALSRNPGGVMFGGYRRRSPIRSPRWPARAYSRDIRCGPAP